MWPRGACIGNVLLMKSRADLVALERPRPVRTIQMNSQEMPGPVGERSEARKCRGDSCRGVFSHATQRQQRKPADRKRVRWKAESQENKLRLELLPRRSGEEREWRLGATNRPASSGQQRGRATRPRALVKLEQGS